MLICWQFINVIYVSEIVRGVLEFFGKYLICMFIYTGFNWINVHWYETWKLLQTGFCLEFEYVESLLLK